MPPRRRHPDALTPRQARFVEEYLVDLNASQAVVRARFRTANPRQSATRLLRIPAVAEAIRRATAERAERMRVTTDRIFLELARIALADIAGTCAWGPEGFRLKATHEIGPDDRAAIAGVNVNRDGQVTRIRLFNKAPALDRLARHLGMYGSRSGKVIFDQTPPPPGDERAEAARQKLYRFVAELKQENEALRRIVPPDYLPGGPRYGQPLLPAPAAAADAPGAPPPRDRATAPAPREAAGKAAAAAPRPTLAAADWAPPRKP